ncbi:MAG: hypothetical protein ABR512_03935 [Desulfopila sp.]
MPLINFGSILGFAEEIENQHLQLYSEAARHPQCAPSHSAFEALAKGARKRLKEVKRVRRENVTEMILETIEGFERKAFIISLPDIATMDRKTLLAKSFELVDRSLDFYEQAAQRLKGQAEVARALKNLCKNHGKDRKKLEEIESETL